MNFCWCIRHYEIRKMVRTLSFLFSEKQGQKHDWIAEILCHLNTGQGMNIKNVRRADTVRC